MHSVRVELIFVVVQFESHVKKDKQKNFYYVIINLIFDVCLGYQILVKIDSYTLTFVSKEKFITRMADEGTGLIHQA